MEIRNSNLNDIKTIQELYQTARDLMKSKGQVVWPSFDEELIFKEIKELRQWKLLVNDEIACIWATTTNDELIWEEKNEEPSVYIHRITTHSNYRGQRLVQNIVKWADQYCEDHQLQYVRLDTVGFNQGLIQHYTKLGFVFVGTKELENTQDLPQHYSQGPVCLFQRIPHTSLGMNYQNRRFKPIEVLQNGEVNSETIFEYHQEGRIVTSEYSGGQIVNGHLIGLVDDNGNIEMRYHQVNQSGELQTGICFSKPEFLESGKIRLHEEWEWTSGNKSKGKSIIEEI